MHKSGKKTKPASYSSAPSWMSKKRQHEVSEKKRVAEFEYSELERMSRVSSGICFLT